MLTFVARFRHAEPPRPHAAALAAIIKRPCFAACTRVVHEFSDRLIDFAPASERTVREYLAVDGTYDTAVVLDAGERGRIASMSFDTGYTRVPGVVASLRSYVIVPLDDAEALVDAAGALARELHALEGVIAVHADYELADRFTISPPQLDDAVAAFVSAGYSRQRLREWRRHSLHPERLEQELAGPEWGLFLSAGHLARLPSSALRESGVFAVVRDLAADLVYLQLTADMRDALAPDFDERLERARTLLRPILMVAPD